jgi:multiple sugar transport system ATP-binding protein
MEAMTMATRIAVQKDGVLQQLGTPQELYTSPDNLFVAGFIGSPAMNFFEASLVGSGEEMYIDAKSFRVEVPLERASKLKEYLGREVIFGIRPEDIHDPEFCPPNIRAGRVKAKVDVTELMGNEVFLYLLTDSKSFIARVDPRTRARVGDEVEARLNMDNIRLFDPQTERAIR